MNRQLELIKRANNNYKAALRLLIQEHERENSQD